MLAAALIQEVLCKSDRAVAIAFFYCDYKDMSRQKPSNILGSLAAQIAKQGEGAFKQLEGFYHSHNINNNISAEYDPEEFRDLLQTMYTNFDIVMVIVDGLDEWESYLSSGKSTCKP